MAESARGAGGLQTPGPGRGSAVTASPGALVAPFSPVSAVAVRDVTVVYPGRIRALDGVSLDVAAGRLVAIAGANGAGKSTLARLLNGLVRPTAGSVAIEGSDTAGIPVRRLAATVGFVFQNPNHQLFAHDVAEELALGPRNLGVSEPEIRERVDAVAERFGLGSLLARHPLRLGLADRKLVALASVLAMHPAILVVDEPTTGQDRAATVRIAGALRDEHDRGVTVVCVSHDMRLLAELAERIIVLEAGRVIADGAPREVFADAAALARARLRPPQIAELAIRLPQLSGRPVALTVAELADELRAADERTRTHRGGAGG